MEKPDGFYIVHLDGRRFEVCVIEGRARYCRCDDSLPIPWQAFDGFALGTWREASLIACE